tara:strand:+ start:275 stop:469 length:195 start_codon:yes stop_codon:yes gene_type:complete
MKRNKKVQQAREEGGVSLFFAQKEASFEFQSGVFSLSPFEGGVNSSKVCFSFFSLFFLSRCFFT